MKVTDARKLIGKRVRWLDGYAWRCEVFAEVVGRNVQTEAGNWYWLPMIEIDSVEIVEPKS